MQEVGLEYMETYISRRQNMVAQFIVTSPILDLCLEAERRMGVHVVEQWWDQEGIYLAGVREEGIPEEGRQDEGKQVDLEGPDDDEMV